MDNIDRQRLLALKAQQKQKELHNAHTDVLERLEQETPHFTRCYRLADAEETAAVLAIADALPYSSPGQPLPSNFHSITMNEVVFPTHPVYLTFFLGNEALLRIVLQGSAQDVLQAWEDWQYISPRIGLIDHTLQTCWVLDFEDHTITSFPNPSKTALLLPKYEHFLP